MDRGVIAGIALCLLALGITVVVLWGLSMQEWWAVAIPVAAMVVVSMTLLFWVGWTLISTEGGPPPGRSGEPQGGPRY